MVGGCTANQRHLADLLSFDPLIGKWKTLPSMSVARSQMGVAVIDDYLYVIGGDNKHQVLDSVERYSFKKVMITSHTHLANKFIVWKNK